uniref:Probable pectate lyase F n=1 Tax=Globodera pallida TaxID=36090 RepID=A0A183BQQ9_GLOPA
MLLFILLTIFVQFFQLRALCDFPQSSQTVTVDSPILVPTYKDFEYTTFVGSSDLLNGDCDVNNGNMKYLMVLENGVTIENAILDNAGMGIYCKGSCTLKNIYFKKLCYHGAGFGYQSPDVSYNYEVIGGGGQGSPDKYFAQSGRGTTTIKNFCAEGRYGKLWCSCGNCDDQMQRHVLMSNVTILGPGLTIASLNGNYGDTASITGLVLYGQDSPNTATEYVCQTYEGLKKMEPMHPIAEITPTQHGDGPCSYSISPINNPTPIPDNPPTTDFPAPVFPDNPPGGGNYNQPGGNYNQPGGNYNQPGGGNYNQPGGGNYNQPGGGYYNQPGGGYYNQQGGSISGGSGGVGKIVKTVLTAGLFVTSTMLNGVGATAAAGNVNVVDQQQALAIKPSSGEWKPPALLPESELGHLNASHVLQNIKSNDGTGNAKNGRRGNLRSVKKAKKPEVVHEISAKTVDAPISRRENVFGAKARNVPTETDCIYISFYKYP